jgi:O-antigen ligase
VPALHNVTALLDNNLSKKSTLYFAQLFLLLAIFSVPFSIALTNIFVVLAFVAFLPVLLSDRRTLEALKSLPSVLAIGLFALILLSSLWSIAPQAEVVQAIRKYSKLLLIPIGLALARSDNALPRRAIVWFIAGTAVLALSSYLVWLDLMPASRLGWWDTGGFKNAVAFKNHITIGILLGFSTLICLSYYFYASSVRQRLAAICSGIFFAFPIIFLTQGRTGYVVLFVGLVTLCILHFRANWKILSVSLIATAVMFAGFFSMSDNFKLRTTHLISEFENYSNSKEMNSSGIRISYYRAGLLLMAEHPVFGLGAGSFSEGFSPTAKKLWPGNDPHSGVRHQPHSEVILIGVQLGVIGLIMYFSLLASLMAAARKSNSYEADTLLLLCVVFGTGAIFNSLLWDATEGHWFALLAGCLYAHVRQSSAAVS